MNNKYQDALNSLNPNYIGEQEYSWRKATEILQELVDKETPMFVDLKTKGKFPNGDGSFHTTFRCPKCNCMLHLDWKEYRKYCPECGQKLNFGESEE